MYKFLLLAGAIISEVIATNALKASDGFTKLWPSLLAAAWYALAFYLLSLTMRYFQMGVIYAIWSGLGIVLISILGIWLFGQKPDLPAILGMGLILAGVMVINLFSKSSVH